MIEMLPSTLSLMFDTRGQNVRTGSINCLPVGIIFVEYRTCIDKRQAAGTLDKGTGMTVRSDSRLNGTMSSDVLQH